MTTYDNTNSGALFKNDRKETASHPDYKGQINVNGVDYWLSAWIKPMKNDPEKRFMSLSVKPKEAPAQQNQAPRNTPQRQTTGAVRGGGGFDDMDSDIPF